MTRRQDRRQKHAQSTCLGAFGLLGILICSEASNARAAPPFTEITSGFELMQNIRPALADDGTVVAAAAEVLHVGDGNNLNLIDLGPAGLEFVPGTSSARAVRVRSEGDIVFVANRPVEPMCDGPGGTRGAFRTDTNGSGIDAIAEVCLFDEIDEGRIGPHIAMSENGTVAFSQIRSSAGAIFRGPVSGPFEVLRSGTGTFFNTQEIDVNDSGRVAVQMEYFDGFSGPLMRGVLIFDTPEQDKLAIDTAVEKLGIGQQATLAINSSGTVAFALNSDFTIVLGEDVSNFDAGVYRAEPTPFNTPKILTKIADKSGDYCGFGRVDIDDTGRVVFEAQLEGELSGCSGPVMDGVFYGSSPVYNRIAVRGEPSLEAHQYFDSILLGEINENGEVSLLTTYSEPLVEPTKVWRVDLGEVRWRRLIEYLLARWWRILSRFLRFGR